MSAFADNWIELYNTQTETLRDAATQDDGTREATVGETTAKCILGVNALNAKLGLADFTNEGGFDFQMLASDFDNPPQAQCAVELPGIGGLVMQSLNQNNGVWYMVATDTNAT